MNDQKNKYAENDLSPEIMHENPTIQNLLKFMEPDSPYFVTIRVSDPKNIEPDQYHFL